MRTVTVLSVLFALCFSLQTQAQTPGNCILGTAENDLDVNNVLARTFNTGSLFFGNTTVSGDGYLVPQNAGTSPIFASGLWVAGQLNGELRAAGSTYNNFEFWPGPLNDDGTLPDPDDCAQFDRIYRVSREDIEDYEAGGAPAPDLAEWPVGLGAPTMDANGDPVEPTSMDQLIDLDAGERPATNDADQALWWVMNDVGNEHERTLTEPLGLEVRVLAYAYDRPDAYGDATFYDIGLTYKGSEVLEDAYLGVFVDPDLGDATDDYTGSDPARGLGFAYNATNSDGVYGTPPPAVGYDLLSCPEGEGGESVGRVMYFENVAAGPTGNPQTGEEIYNYLQGLWLDGVPLTIGGNGYNPGSDEVTDFAFSGNPPEFWSELNVDGNGASNPPGDRRFFISNGPLTLTSGEEQTITVGILWAIGDDHLDSVTELKAASDFIQQDFGGCALVSVEDGGAPDRFSLDPAYPNPFAAETALRLSLDAPGRATVEVLDVLGRRVDVLLDEAIPAGPRTLVWRPRAALPNGVYFVRMHANGAVVTRAVVLQR